MVLFGVFGVYIIPKWLIKVPGHFGILFGWFRELRKFCQIWSRRPPNYYQNASTNTRKIMESSWKNIIYVNLWHQKIRNFLNSGPTKHLFFLKVFCPPPPPKKTLVYTIVFEGHWPWYALENLWRPIILTTCKSISKS